jgi:hypothetical protein
MSDTTETIVISGTKEAAEAIRNQIDAQPGSQSHLSERKNLDGGAAAWIVIATIVGQTLPHVLGFIKDYLAAKQANQVAKQVKSLEVGNWKVENPTPEIIDRFLEMTAVKSKPE